MRGNLMRTSSPVSPTSRCHSRAFALSGSPKSKGSRGHASFTRTSRFGWSCTPKALQCSSSLHLFSSRHDPDLSSNRFFTSSRIIRFEELRPAARTYPASVAPRCPGCRSRRRHWDRLTRLHGVLIHLRSPSLGREAMEHLDDRKTSESLRRRTEPSARSPSGSCRKLTP